MGHNAKVLAAVMLIAGVLGGAQAVLLYPYVGAAVFLFSVVIGFFVGIVGGQYLEY